MEESTLLKVPSRKRYLSLERASGSEKRVRSPLKLQGSDVEMQESLLLEQHKQRVRDLVFMNDDLLKEIFKHLSVGELVRASAVQQKWRNTASDPSFWGNIVFETFDIPNATVVAMLNRNAAHIQNLDLRNVQVSPTNISNLLDNAVGLQSLQMRFPSDCIVPILNKITNLVHLTKLALVDGPNWTDPPAALPPQNAVHAAEGGAAAGQQQPGDGIYNYHIHHHQQQQQQQQQQQAAEIGVIPPADGAAQGPLGNNWQEAMMVDDTSDDEWAHPGWGNAGEVEAAANDMVPIIMPPPPVAVVGGGLAVDAGQAAPPAAPPAQQNNHHNHPHNPHHHHLPPHHQFVTLAHPTLRHLEIDKDLILRLAINTPRLEELRLCRFQATAINMHPAPMLRKITLEDCRKLQIGCISSLLRVNDNEVPAAALPGLQKLVINGGTKVTDEFLSRIATILTNIQKLTLGHLTITGTGLHGGWNALQNLCISHCESLTTDELQQAVATMPALQELSIACCMLVTSLAFDSASLTQLHLSGNRTLSTVTLRCPRLEKVTASPSSIGLASLATMSSISISSYAMESIRWTNFPSLKNISLDCPNLQVLELTDFPSLSDTLFESLLRCDRLETIRLEECPLIRDAIIRPQSVKRAAFVRCESLTRIELDCVSFGTFRIVDCTRLESLHLRSNGMQHLSLDTCGYLSELHLQSTALQSLDLKGCSALVTVDLQCPGLKSVNADFCRELPDQALHGLATAVNLAKLNLSACSRISSEGFRDLSALQHLEHLDLSYLSITDPVAIHEVCRNLTSLSMSNNRALTPEGLASLLVYLSRHANNLECLDISYCHQLPAKLLAEVALSGSLKQAVMKGCDGIDDHFVSLLNQPYQYQTIGNTHTVKALYIGGKHLTHFYLGTQSPSSPRGGSVQQAVVETPLAGLEELHLNVSRKLKRAELALPNLQKLHLENNSALESISLDCPRLRYLSLQGCSELAVDVVSAALIASCPELRELNLQHCGKITSQDKVALLERWPLLSVKLESPRYCYID